MAQSPAIPPQHSERNMPEGGPAFKPLQQSKVRNQVPERNLLIIDPQYSPYYSLLAGDCHAAAVLGPASFRGFGAFRPLLAIGDDLDPVR